MGSTSYDKPRSDPYSVLTRFRLVKGGPINLPAQLTPIIGRDKEMKEVRELLLRGDIRLVTLTGPGGTGKTRLGVEIALSLVDDFPSGVCFTSLAAVTDPNLVPSTVLDTLGVQELGGRTALDRLKDYLRDREVLLVLDNFEHVISAAPLVAELLRDCPKFKVLATSRAPLQISGEHEFAVEPLPVPDLGKLRKIEALLEYASAVLFIQRARAANANFALTVENARTIAEICTKLDGLPLAIELAAPRLRASSPEALLKRLGGGRLRLLTSGARDLPARQRTLRDTIAWSYDLLEERDKKLFRRLAPFIGGFNEETAQAVCNLNQDLDGDVISGLERLVERNLIRATEQKEQNELRFGMLETIREYANESLRGSGEWGPIHEGFADYFIEFAEKANQELKGPGQSNSLVKLDLEHDNLRASLQWSIENRDAKKSHLFAAALWRFWQIHGHLTEGRVWLTKVFAMQGSVDKRLRAKVLLGAGALATSQNDYPTARRLLNESLVLSREAEDMEGVAFALNSLGVAARSQGDFSEGRRLHEEGLSLFQELGNKWGAALLLNNLGVGARNEGDYDKAKLFHEQSLGLFRELGDKRFIAKSLFNLGLILERKGQYQAAHELLNESFLLFDELSERTGISESLFSLGSVARRQGRVDDACVLLFQSLTVAIELGYREIIANCLEQMAGCSCSQGKAEQATLFLSAADALREAVHYPVPPAYRADIEHDLALVRGLLGNKFQDLWARGRAMSLEEVVHLTESFLPTH